MPTSSVKEAPVSQRPETFRLPKSGAVDRYFGLSRSFYYRGEELGYWTLLRIRERGKRRGVTLIPFDAVSAFIHAQSGSCRRRHSDYVDETELRIRAENLWEKEKAAAK
jgi:hypothetical protein